MTTKKGALKQTKIGFIVSDKMNKTAVVKIERMVTHPLYKKRYKVNKKYKALNPENKFQIGDKVLIELTRPLSRQKKWRIVKKI